MERHQHPSNNAVLGAPKGVSHDDCSALPITRVMFPDGLHAVVSFWRPSAEELQRLNDGKTVGLVIWGHTHPPVWVGVDGDPGLPTGQKA